MAARGLVCDPVVDNVEMFCESLGEAARGLADVLLLALGAGDQVHHVAGRAVHPAVDPHRLTYSKCNCLINGQYRGKKSIKTQKTSVSAPLSVQESRV